MLLRSRTPKREISQEAPVSWPRPDPRVGAAVTLRQERSTVSRRLAYVVISVVFAGFLANAFFYVLQAGATPARITGSLACLLTIGYLQLRVFSRPSADLRSAKAYLALGALALLAFVPV